MRKVFYFGIVFLLFNLFLFAQPLFALAKTSNEYLGEAYNYYEKGEYDKAILILEEAVSLYPSEPNIHYGLLDSYNEIGQKHYFSKELCLRIIYYMEFQ